MTINVLKKCLLKYWLRTSPLVHFMSVLLKKWFREILTINSDQRIHEAPYIDFIGVPARTSTGLSRLARSFNLPVLIAHVERTHGAHHKIIFDEFINIPHTDDANADEINGMKLVNDAMARVIKRKPDEYLWIHRRWK